MRDTTASAAKHDATWYYGRTREILAAGKAALDAVFEPDPRFLGPKEPGVARAIAAADAAGASPR